MKRIDLHVHARPARFSPEALRKMYDELSVSRGVCQGGDFTKGQTTLDLYPDSVGWMFCSPAQLINDGAGKNEILEYMHACVEAGAAAVMSAYNRYNGHFCGSSRYLLRDVLKGEWDFDGFVISDFFFGTHSTEKCINAGLDVEMHMRKYYSPALIKAALRRGKITRAPAEVRRCTAKTRCTSRKWARR